LYPDATDLHGFFWGKEKDKVWNSQIEGYYTNPFRKLRKRLSHLIVSTKGNAERSFLLCYQKKIRIHQRLH